MISKGKLFGTDGIRGKYGEDLTQDIAYKLGNALGRRGKTIVVGRDTRLSGVELYKSLRKGILDAGADIVNLHIVPTPVVAYTTLQSKSDFGVVITASHNSKEYNGLKVFSSNGSKLNECEVLDIENDMKSKLYIANKRGNEMDDKSYIDSYKNMILSHFFQINGLNVAFDLTNGALSTVGKDIINSLFKDAIIINDDGDGNRINDGTGALYPEQIMHVVKENNLDIGFAFDGDGDRIVAVSKDGKIINGDIILYIIAKYLKSKDRLTNNIAIGTIYTNVGVEKDLSQAGIKLYRSDVGDNNVASMIEEKHAAIGAERAGHVILSDFEATGDGLLVALFLCLIMCDTGKSIDELASCKEYASSNFDISTLLAHEIAQDNELKGIITDIERDSKARILLRASGTEAKLRLMVECQDMDSVDKIGKALVGIIKNKYKL